MGVLRFRLNPPDVATSLPALKKAYVTGQDRTPGRVVVEVRPGRMAVARDGPESVRVHAPWPVPGFGTPILATATLAERAEPFDLGVELARGRLNDVRNQAADWKQIGLRLNEPLERRLDEARRAFARAATSRDDPPAAAAASRECLIAALDAGEMLAAAYTAQILRRRLDHAPKIPTVLACGVDGDPKDQPWAAPLAEAVTGVRLRAHWSRIAPDEGRFRWEEADAQVQWARKRKLAVAAGPLVDLRPEALPHWLWLWSGDFDEIQSQAVDFVKHAVARYRGKVATWHLVGRVASGEILGMSEEEQIRLTARLLQVGRQVDPQAQFVVDFDRPWAEWMASSPYQLGPLHLGDSLARADLGLAGIGLEIAPGYAGPGSPMHDLLDFSRLLDLYSLINLPIHVSLVVPSSAEPDPQADPAACVDLPQWPAPPDEAAQAARGLRWASLAAAKPFVRSVTWIHATDATPHIFARGGLVRADGAPKPILAALKQFRTQHLG